MRLVFTPEAQSELLEARAWYEQRSPGLGFEFSRAVDAAVSRLMRAPEAAPSIEGKFRHVITRRFPYSIIYCVTETEIIVVSCFHHRRSPGSWPHGTGT